MSPLWDWSSHVEETRRLGVVSAGPPGAGARPGTGRPPSECLLMTRSHAKCPYCLGTALGQTPRSRETSSTFIEPHLIDEATEG